VLRVDGLTVCGIDECRRWKWAGAGAGAGMVGIGKAMEAGSREGVTIRNSIWREGGTSEGRGLGWRVRVRMRVRIRMRGVWERVMRSLGECSPKGVHTGLVMRVRVRGGRVGVSSTIIVFCSRCIEVIITTYTIIC